MRSRSTGWPPCDVAPELKSMIELLGRRLPLTSTRTWTPERPRRPAGRVRLLNDELPTVVDWKDGTSCVSASRSCMPPPSFSSSSPPITSIGVGLEMTVRSEEHTSELQSLMRISYAVFCLTQKIHDTQENTQEHMNNKQ